VQTSTALAVGGREGGDFFQHGHSRGGWEDVQFDATVDIRAAANFAFSQFANLIGKASMVGHNICPTTEQCFYDLNIRAAMAEEQVSRLCWQQHL